MALEQEIASRPKAHVKMVYLSPVAPHWDIVPVFGDKSVIAQFKERAQARLLFLPPHDPQFRRNRERISRDAEREGIILEWELGFEEEESASPGK